MSFLRKLNTVAVSLFVLTAIGCKVVEKTASLPVKAVTAVVPGGESHPPDPAGLQIQLQRFADEYSSRTIASLDDYARRAGTPEARQQALKWKVSAGAAAVSIASGPSPYANLLDFLAVTSITRMALEEIWSKSEQGSAFQPWLETSRALETNAWNLAAGLFTPQQREELRGVIRLWWESNPGVHTGFFVRPQEFSWLIRQSIEKTDRSGGFFSFIGLDPTVGLDPAVREVTRTRLFAERAMFMIQRMPFLVRWQVELTADELLGGAQITAAVDSAERLSHAVAELPDRFTAERKAILEALEAQDGKLRTLAAEVGRTLTAGEKMSTSLNETLGTFDALMKRFGVGEPQTTPPKTNAAPFNILDYARTAQEVAAMSQQLDALIKDTTGTLDAPALDKRIADLNALLKRAQGDARSVLNHAFLLAAGLILLAFVCAVVYRRTRPAD